MGGFYGVLIYIFATCHYATTGTWIPQTYAKVETRNSSHVTQELRDAFLAFFYTPNSVTSLLSD